MWSQQEKKLVGNSQLETRVEHSHWSRSLRHCALIGWLHSVATPILLWHKDTALENISCLSLFSIRTMMTNHDAQLLPLTVSLWESLSSALPHSVRDLRAQRVGRRERERNIWVRGDFYKLNIPPFPRLAWFKSLGIQVTRSVYFLKIFAIIVFQKFNTRGFTVWSSQTAY